MASKIVVLCINKMKIKKYHCKRRIIETGNANLCMETNEKNLSKLLKLESNEMFRQDLLKE